MTGRIIKAISGFYYVESDGNIIECKARGVFRDRKIKPLVGDVVTFEIISDKDLKGNITDIAPRKSDLIRPSVANVTQALVVLTLSKPTPNFVLLDKFLTIMEYQKIPCAIAISKADDNNLSTDYNIEEISKIYGDIGYPVFVFSSNQNTGIEEIKNYLKNNTTVLAGASGVGKSTLINHLQSDVIQQTGEISTKLNRGKNTTRHTKLITIDSDTYIIDTPGFTSLSIDMIDPVDLQVYYKEFGKYSSCYYNTCAHIDEPDCAIKDAVQNNEISKLRYSNYKHLYKLLKDNKKSNY